MHTSRRTGARGQVIVILALAMVPLLIMAGLVIDGGYAFSQQRNAQNGVDAAAEAGAVVLVQNLPFRLKNQPQPRTDQDVLNAVVASASGNGITSTPSAVYTDIEGNLINVTVGSLGGQPPPANAYGVRASGDVAFGTFFSSVAGLTGFTASAKATAVAGSINSICAATSDACNFIQITFPFGALTTCTGTNAQSSTTTFPYTFVDNPVAGNEMIIPLCSTAAGNVGYLDIQPDHPDCQGNGAAKLACEIRNPTQTQLDLPIWIHAVTGNTNAELVQDALNELTGQTVGLYEPGEDRIVQIPLYECIANNVGQVGPNPQCPNPPVDTTGSLTYYRIVGLAAFILDKAYIQQVNPECNHGPGSPLVGGNGGTGCLKGWMTHITTSGSVGMPTTATPNHSVWGVQLIR
jgi:Flp pilus assembly protein TadG